MNYGVPFVVKNMDGFQIMLLLCADSWDIRMLVCDDINNDL